MIFLTAALLTFNIFTLAYARVEEAPDGSVCFNGCNGHGNCIDYSCHCFVGYHGDDCGTTFADESRVIPILSAGHFNLTRKNFTQAVTKNKIMLVGFSSCNCHRCIQAENEYMNISSRLTTLNIPFGRADADSLKSLAQEFGATELPALVVFRKQRPLLYKGAHSSDAVVAYIRKLLEKPVRSLKTVSDVTEFLASRAQPQYSVSTMMVAGFFGDAEGVEEDDYEDFSSLAAELQTNEDVYFGAVTSPATAEWFKANGTIDRTPSMVLAGEGGAVKAVNLDELYGAGYEGGTKGWILKNALPLVGKMTGQNFELYNKQNLPMLMLFLDLTDEHRVITPRTVGGRSGGLINEALLEEFREAAREHVDRLLFVYLDGTLYQDQMRALGLYGGKERLPSLAFNTRDGAQIPFPEQLPINKDTLLQFCADFVNGKLRTKEGVAEMNRRALQSVRPVNPKNTAVRKEMKAAPANERGVSEHFGDGNAGDDAVVAVRLSNFDEVVLSEGKDVVLLLHSATCEPCAHFAVYYKRMAERFKALQIPTLTIAQMDVSSETPPAALNLLVGPLPLVVMVPANSKHAPWTFYSGIGKVQSMMKWVHAQSSQPFELPNLPHLSEQQKSAYKTQVREREEALDAKRSEEKRAMAAEDRARAEVLRRKRKEEKKLLQQQQPKEESTTTTATAAASSTSSGGIQVVHSDRLHDLEEEDDSDEF